MSLRMTTPKRGSYPKSFHNSSTYDDAKLFKHRFWHWHENGLIKEIQTIPHNIFVSFKLASLYCGLRLILVYPNP